LFWSEDFLFSKKISLFFFAREKFSEKKIEENLKNPKVQIKYFPRRRKVELIEIYHYENSKFIPKT